LTNASQVSAGGIYSIALKSDGTVIAWGGLSIPVGITNVVQISAGYSHALALKGDGTVVAWGQDGIPEGLTNVVQVAAGYGHSLALKSDGTVVAWGDNYYGQATTPFGLTNVVQVSAGTAVSAALKSDGTVVAWGNQANDVTRIPGSLTNVVQISVAKVASLGSAHIVALKSDGTVVAWGGNQYGQTSIPSGITNVVQVSAGNMFTLVLKSNGTVVGWGMNRFGNASSPEWLRNVVQISAGGYHTTVLGFFQKLTQFDSIPNHTYGDAPFSISLPISSSPSGMPVMYAVSGPATLFSNVLSITGAGTVTLTADQFGNDIYSAALQVSTSFVVDRASQTLSSFSEIPNHVFGDDPITITLPTSSSSSGYPVMYSVSGPATLSSNLVTITGVGTVTLTADQSGDSNYAPGNVSTSFVVSQAPQTLTAFDVISNRTFSTSPFSITLPTSDSSSGYPVIYSVSGPATLKSNMLTLTGIGTVTLTADQSGDSNYMMAPQVMTSFRVSQGSQSINLPVISSMAMTTNLITLPAAASSGQPILYSITSGPANLVSSNQLALTGIGRVTVQADQPGDENWQAASSVTQSFNVRMGSQTISFPALNSPYTPFFTPKAWEFGDEIYPLTNVVATSELPVSFTSSAPKVATIVSNTMTILGVGTTTITASQPGDSNWFAATPVSQTFVVGKSSQRIYADSQGMDGGIIAGFTYVPKKTLTLQPSRFKASSGLPVTLSVKSGPAILKGTTLSITGAGNVVVKAKQAGNKTYLPAEEFTIPFTVDQAEQTIAPLAAIPGKVNGAAPFGIKTPKASSGLPVSLSIQSGPARISRTNMTITGAGTVVVAADQAGNANYFAAPTVTTSFTVAKGSQTITWAAPAKVTNGASTVQLAAKASSGLPVTYLSYAGNIRVTTNGLVTILGSGTASITASQAGDANWNAARNLSQNLVVIIPAIMTGGASNRISGIASASSIPSLAARPTSFPLTRPSLSGSVVAWGDNSYGETKLPAGLTNIVQLSSRGLHSLALRTNGLVVAWGWNAYGQTNVPATLSNAVQVAAGASFSAALRANGTVALWGDNSMGQMNLPIGLSNAVQIAAGSHHAVALRNDGTVAAWGWNGYGQTDVPTDLTNVVQVAAGYFHSVALKSDGTVVAWGDDTYGETDIPLDLTNVVRIAAGLNHTVALKGDGTVAAWGWDNAGQCDVPSDLTGVAQIATGGNTVFAVTTNGTLVTWGDNSYGQRKPPTGLSGVYQFVLGLYHALGLKR
jgi:alpha-tubulin suppressor-like RCC1 family protein